MAYGWEAEAKFCEFEEEERARHAFFRNFKMELHRKKVIIATVCVVCVCV